MTWQQHLKQAIRDLPTLGKALGLPVTSLAGAKAEAQFPVFVPLPYLQRIKPGTPDDPLLRQVLPVPAEDLDVPGFSVDPLDESGATLTAGLLQKYPGRVLLVTNGTCAVHCRYCFRRHFPYSETPRSLDQWTAALETIASDRSIEEVILSGGDPLTIVDATLQQLVQAISSIPHIRRLRWHTRLPIMIPQRVTDTLLETLSIFTNQPSRQSIVVIHSNHAQEIDDQVATALQRLRDSGSLLLNQSVLLRGINDQAETLIELSQRLLECQTLPYYLHQLDRVRGVGHFEVSRSQGERLIEQMRSRLPGYAVPRFVKEEPGQSSKTVWK